MLWWPLFLHCVFEICANPLPITFRWDGQKVNLDGTSAATPTAASIFALLNDALICHGKPAMGFLNPWLYKKGKEVSSGSFGVLYFGPATPAAIDMDIN